MITMTATIELGQNGDGKIETANVSVGGNNVSSFITSVIDTKVAGSSIFLLGKSKLGDGSAYCADAEYFIGKEFCDENGYFNPSYDLTITGSNIQGISVVFDDYNIEYATLLEVDGKLHNNNSITFTTEVSDQTLDTHVIKMLKWSEPNSPPRIQGIFVSLNIDLSVLQTVSMNFKRMTRGDNDLPSWGIISSTGNIEFNDLNQSIQEYIKREMIKQNLKCTINLNNTLTMTEQTIATMYTDKWNYDNDSRIVNVSLKNDLEEWQNIFIDAISYDPNSVKPMSFAELYNILYKLTPDKYNMLTLRQLDQKTSLMLQHTYCQYPMLNACSLWSAWSKLCEALQLYIYKNSANQTVCTYTYGE